MRGLLEDCSYRVKVHSIFDHAINLIAKENWLITILPKGFSEGPQTIILGNKDFQDLKSPMAIDSIWDFHRLINIKDARIIRGKIVNRLSINDMTKLEANIIYFQRLLDKKGNKTGLLGKDNIYSDYASRWLEPFSIHFQKHEFEEAGALLSHLIGLGPGLTPSGDDFILGIFTSIYFLGLNKKGKTKLVETAIKDAVDRTNLISYNMLRQGALGGFISWVENMINALIYGDIEQIDRSFYNMEKIGSSSGSDISAGILYGSKEILKLYKRAELS